jgi:hypothetical protein
MYFYYTQVIQQVADSYLPDLNILFCGYNDPGMDLHVLPCNMAISTSRQKGAAVCMLPGYRYAFRFGKVPYVTGNAGSDAFFIPGSYQAIFPAAAAITVTGKGKMITAV